MLAVGSSLFVLRKCSLARSAYVEQIITQMLWLIEEEWQYNTVS